MYFFPRSYSLNESKILRPIKQNLYKIVKKNTSNEIIRKTLNYEKEIKKKIYKLLE